MPLARRHSGSHAGPRHLGGDVLCLDGKVGRPAKDVRVILGGGVANADDTIGRLLGRWLSDSFGYAYAENRTCSDGNLAIEAFYDSLHVHFDTGRRFFGILGQVQCTADEFRCLTELDSLELKFRGLARAHPSMSAQRVQVILEDLPGALEFIGSSKRREAARLQLVNWLDQRCDPKGRMVFRQAPGMGLACSLERAPTSSPPSAGRLMPVPPVHRSSIDGQRCPARASR